jgi:hypothetical protein
MGRDKKKHKRKFFIMRVFWWFFGLVCCGMGCSSFWHQEVPWSNLWLSDHKIGKKAPGKSFFLFYP